MMIKLSLLEAYLQNYSVFILSLSLIYLNEDIIMWTTFQSFTLRDNNKHKATLRDTKYLSVKFRPNVECDQVVTGRTCITVIIAFAAVSLADYCLPII